MASTPNIQKIVRAAEIKQATIAEGVRAELATVNEALPGLREQVADIADGITEEHEVKAMLKKGEDVPDGALTFARERDERAGYLLKVREAQALTLSKSLPADSPLLADKVAGAFKAAIPGVPVITTTAPFKSFQSDIPSDTPPVVVLCVDPLIETDSFHQTLSGTVKAYFLRSPLMRPLQVSKIEGAHRANKPDCALSVTSNHVGDESGWVTVGGNDSLDGNQMDPSAIILDVLNVRVSGVVDGLPVIGKVNARNGVVKTWTLATLSGFLNTGTFAAGTLNDVSDIAEQESFVVKYGMGCAVRAVHPTSTEEIEGNERTLTVRHILNLANVEPVGFADDMREGAEGWINSTHLDAGVLTEATVTPRLDGGVMGARHMVDVVLVFMSLTA